MFLFLGTCESSSRICSSEAVDCQMVRRSAWTSRSTGRLCLFLFLGGGAILSGGSAAPGRVGRLCAACSAAFGSRATTSRMMIICSRVSLVLSMDACVFTCCGDTAVSSSLSSGLLALHHCRMLSSSCGYRQSLPSFIFLGLRRLFRPSSEVSTVCCMLAMRAGKVSRYFLSICTVVRSRLLRKSRRSFMSRFDSRSRLKAERARDSGPLAKYASDPLDL